jgi:hypothetical protein
MLLIHSLLYFCFLRIIIILFYYLLFLFGWNLVFRVQLLFIFLLNLLIFILNLLIFILNLLIFIFNHNLSSFYDWLICFNSELFCILLILLFISIWNKPAFNLCKVNNILFWIDFNFFISFYLILQTI